MYVSVMILRHDFLPLCTHPYKSVSTPPTHTMFHTHTHMYHIHTPTRTAPSAPTLTLVSATSSTTIQVEPDTLNGRISSYLISYYETTAGISSTQTETTLGDTTAIELSGLSVFTNHSVFVQAITVLLGPPSETLTAVTQEDSEYTLNAVTYVLCVVEVSH